MSETTPETGGTRGDALDSTYRVRAQAVVLFYASGSVRARMGGTSEGRCIEENARFGRCTVPVARGCAMARIRREIVVRGARAHP